MPSSEDSKNRVIANAAAKLIDSNVLFQLVNVRVRELVRQLFEEEIGKEVADRAEKLAKEILKESLDIEYKETLKKMTR